MHDSCEVPPSAVVAHFHPHTFGLTWQRIGGGLSGASVWRGSRDDSPRLALKSWPPGTAPERIEQIHQWMKRANRPFVPVVIPGRNRATICSAAGRIWDCCIWLEGAPCEAPTVNELEAACRTVAELHQSWEAESRRDPCPAIRNRLWILDEFRVLQADGSGELPGVTFRLDPLLRQAAAVAARSAQSITTALRPWAMQEMQLQPCVRDLRAAHLLFLSGWVNGIVDYGAMAIDHPAVDLARLLSEYSAAGEDRFHIGVRAYQQVRRNNEVTEEYVRVLAHTGTICSLLGWVVRLAYLREAIFDETAILERLSQLLARVDSYAPFGTV